MGRGKPLARTKSKKQELHRVLIYCEGECTESQYFTGLRGDLRGIPVQIVMGPAHGVPTELVRAAVKHKERAHLNRADRCAPYDSVWCVMDVEAPHPHPDLPEALNTAKRNGIEVALSNPCFELWLLLHFQDVTGHRSSAAAQRMLERHELCGYRAHRKHIDYAALRDGHTAACGRAGKLRATADKGYLSNPWTDVDGLVSGLLAQRDAARH